MNMSPADSTIYYTPQDVAQIFQVHPETVRQNARTRKWPHIKLGPRTTRFTDEHIAQIVAMSQQSPPAEAGAGPRGSRRRRTTS